MLAERKSIPLKPDTIRRLRKLRKRNKTYDDVVNDLIEDAVERNPPRSFLRELDRRRREEPTVPLEDVRRRLRL